MGIEEILKKEGIKDFAKDIRTMNKRELQNNFSFKENDKINVTLLIKNLIWQAYTWIKAGKMEPLEGNIRSFWYLSIKHVLSRLGFNTSGPRFPEKVYDAFLKMVVDYRLFRYIDMGFLDERIYHRTIGKTNGNLILYVEKDGLFSLARQVAIENQATAISSGGFPSYLTLEFFLSNMARAGLLREPVHIFIVVDYDPSGYLIEREFVGQFQKYDVEVGSTHSLVTPQVIPKELLDIARYKLKKGTTTSNWVKATGGINNEPYGLEADALGGKKIRLAISVLWSHIFVKEAKKWG